MAEFRWKRGLLHALIPFGAVVAMGVFVVLVKDVADPEKFGEGLGRFALVALLAGMAISYLFQTGKRKAAWAVTAGIGALVVGVAVALLLIDPAPKIDRRPLIDDGVTLRHPSLHFSLKRPPAEYHDAPQLVSLMGDQGKDTVIYAYAPAAPSVGLVIGVLWGATDVAETTRGIKRGIDRPGVTWREDKPGHLVAAIQGVTLRVELHQVDGAIVSVMVISQDPTALADVISSFQR